MDVFLSWYAEGVGANPGICMEQECVYGAEQMMNVGS